jgi:hypothetical protein
MRNRDGHCVAVYDGREPIGFVVELKCGRYAAYDLANDFVGEFSSMQAAMDALGVTALVDREDRAV